MIELSGNLSINFPMDVLRKYFRDFYINNSFFFIWKFLLGFHCNNLQVFFQKFPQENKFKKKKQIIVHIFSLNPQLVKIIVSDSFGNFSRDFLGNSTQEISSMIPLEIFLEFLYNNSKDSFKKSSRKFSRNSFGNPSIDVFKNLNIVFLWFPTEIPSRFL